MTTETDAAVRLEIGDLVADDDGDVGVVERLSPAGHPMVRYPDSSLIQTSARHLTLIAKAEAQHV